MILMSNSTKHSKTSEDGFIPIYLLIAAVIFSGIAGSSIVQTTTTTFPSESTTKSVLGENNQEKEKKEELKKMEERVKEAEKKKQEQEKENKIRSNEIQKKAAENQTTKPKPTFLPESVNNKVPPQKPFKSESEFESTNSQKLKTKIEDDGTFKMEYEDKKSKFKYVVENGRIKIESENELDEIENEQELELRSRLENELEEKMEEEGIEIASSSGKPIFSKNGIGATSHFPLSINPETNQLIVTTPAGQKIVTVLPDQAVRNMIEKKYITIVENQENIASESGQLDNTISLETRNDEPVYRIKGKKNHKIFGLIPVETETTIYASAETGNPVAQEQSLLASFIDLLSPN